MGGENDQVIQRYYDALNDERLEDLDQIVAPGFVVENSGSVLDLAAFQSMRQVYVIGFPDLRHEIRQLVREGHHSAVLTETTGTHLGPFLGHTPTARSFRVHGIDLIEFDDFRLSRILSVFDTLGMLNQIGIYRPMVV